MKKLTLFLLSILCSIGMSWADTTWDFTTITTSNFPDGLSSDAVGNWGKYSSNRSVFSGVLASPGGIVYNDTEGTDAFAPFSGLKMICPSGKFRVYGNGTGVEGTGNGVYFVIPVTAGQNVTVTASQQSGNTNKGTVSNATNATEYQPTSTSANYTFTAEADGDMNIQLPNKCCITKIVIAEASGKATVPADDLKWSASSLTVFSDQVSPVFPSLTNTLSLSISYSSSNTSAASINATTGVVTIEGVGTTVISAIFAGDATYDPKTVTYTLTVKAPEIITSGARVWDYTSAAPSEKPDNGLYYNSTCSDEAGTNNGLKGIKLDGNGFAYFHTPGVAGTLYITFGIRKGSTPAQIQVYTDDTKATQIGETLVQEGAPAVDTKSVAISAENTTIYIARSSGETVVTKIVWIPAGATETVNVTSAGYATYTPAVDVVVPANNVVYYASEVSHDAITFTALAADATVKAGEGLLIKGAGEHTFAVTTGATALGASNKLIGVLVDTDLSSVANAYVLAMDEGVVAFCEVETGTLAAGKAYLVRPAGAGAPLQITFADEITAIESIEQSATAVKFFENGQIYILKAGRVYNVTGQIIR